jgi:glycosyltransferase involved in cell wall biosynthesis
VTGTPGVPRSHGSPTFAIASNGLQGDGPAQALRDYLVARAADVVMIEHALAPSEGGRHRITRYEGGTCIGERTLKVPLRPPFSFAVDPLVPLWPRRVDVWFGFNPLAAARGLAARSMGRAGRVVLWSVDFTPQRFGAGVTTRLYDRLDRFCCLRANARVELSEQARDARNARYGIATPAEIVPMGTWLTRIPSAPADGYARRRVVFVGNLVAGKGVEVLLDALVLIDVEADIVGGGELEDDVRERVRRLGLDRRVRVHGFIPDHRDVERIVSGASVAIAPYAPEDASYTRFADPGKLKTYLAAGLPIVLTAVPPNAGELARDAGAEVVAYDAAAIAAAIERALASRETWRARHEAALAYAEGFDWERLLADALPRLGVSVPSTNPAR